MSMLDEMMAAGGTDVLADAFYDSEAVTYRAPPEAGAEAFKVDANIGIIEGDQDFVDGDLVKILRLTVIVRTVDLIANKITGLQGRATISVAGLDWSVDLAKSRWSPSQVMFGLKRREITSFQQMENNAAVR